MISASAWERNGKIADHKLPPSAAVKDDVVPPGLRMKLRTASVQYRSQKLMTLFFTARPNVKIGTERGTTHFGIPTKWVAPRR